MFLGTARPLGNPAVTTAPQGGLLPGTASPYPPNPAARGQVAAQPYPIGRPGAYSAPKQESEKGWFGLPKLDLGKLFRRKPQNPTYGPVAAPTALQPSPSAWRGTNPAEAAIGYPPQVTGEGIRQPEWNHPDPPQFGNGMGNNLPPPVYGTSTAEAGAGTDSGAAAVPQWNPHNPYAAPYAVPPSSDSTRATNPPALPLTALPPQGGQIGAATPLAPSAQARQAARIAAPTPYAGPTGTLFGGTGSPIPHGNGFAKPTFWDRVTVWWKDVTTPRRDNPRAALLPPGQVWQNLQNRLEPRPQTPGQDPFSAQRGAAYPVYSPDAGAASAMQRHNYSPALLPPPRPQLPGSIPRW